MQPAFTIQDLTTFDWFLVALVFVSAFTAFRRGIVLVLFSFAGLVAGIVLAAWNYVKLAGVLHRWITNSSIAQFVAFLAILIGVSVIFSYVAHLVRKTVRAVGLSSLDRLLGAVFGLLRGFLTGVAVMIVLTAFVPDSTLLKNSRLAPCFLAGAHAVSFVVPKGFKEQMAAGANHLLQQTPERIRPHGSF